MVSTLHIPSHKAGGTFRLWLAETTKLSSTETHLDVGGIPRPSSTLIRLGYLLPGCSAKERAYLRQYLKLPGLQIVCHCVLIYRSTLITVTLFHLSRKLVDDLRLRY